MELSKIGLYLKEKRIEYGLTQQELADLLSVSNKTISKWECGRGLPDYEYLIKLAEIFHVTLEDILSTHFTYEKEQKDNCYSQWYIFPFYLNYFLSIFIIFKLFDIANIFQVENIPQLIDGYAILFMVIGVNIIAAIFHQEKPFWIMLNETLFLSLKLDDKIYNKILVALKYRMIYAFIVGFMLFIFRLMKKLINGYYIDAYNDDWHLIILPLIYLAFMEIYYVYILLFIRYIKLNKVANILKIMTALIIVLIPLLLVANIPGKKTAIRTDNICINIIHKNDSFYAIANFVNMPQQTNKLIKNFKGKSTTVFSFNNRTIEYDENAFFYEIYDDLDRVSKELDIPLLNSAYNVGKCAYVRGLEGYSDEIICSEIKYYDLLIDECVFINVEPEKVKPHTMTDIIQSSTMPITDYCTKDGIEYYFVLSGSKSAAYVFDGNVWYQFITEGTKELLKNYVFSLERSYE